MSKKQNPKADEDDSLPRTDEGSRARNGPLPTSYYYDDSTGYEVYDEKVDDDDDDGDHDDG